MSSYRTMAHINNIEDNGEFPNMFIYKNLNKL